jgi:hypothetical protein
VFDYAAWDRDGDVASPYEWAHCDGVGGVLFFEPDLKPAKSTSLEAQEPYITAQSECKVLASGPLGDMVRAEISKTAQFARHEAVQG